MFGLGLKQNAPIYETLFDGLGYIGKGSGPNLAQNPYEFDYVWVLNLVN